MPEDARSARAIQERSSISGEGSRAVPVDEQRSAPSFPEVSREVRVERWRDGALTSANDRVAEEVPVALVYNGTPHVVMLTTPSDLEDLATGFTLSEAIVRSANEIRAVTSKLRDDGALEAQITIAPERFSELLRRQRNMTGRTGCGLCGAENVEDAIRHPAKVSDGMRVGAAELHEVLAVLASKQTINAQTGSVHAAAWVEPRKGIQLVREDVGRHNALDKAIGAVVRAKRDFGLESINRLPQLPHKPLNQR